MAFAQLNIEFKGIDLLNKALEEYGERAEKEVYEVLLGNARNIAKQARSRAPRGKTGRLKRSIRAGRDRTARIAVRVYTSGVKYAPYQEFGTGRGARAYVPTLPTEIQRIALRYKRPPTPKNPNITPKKFLWNSVVDQQPVIIKTVREKLLTIGL